MRKEVFEEGEFYHIYSRGVDKRPVFSDNIDRLRFINTLYVLNNFLTIPDRFNLILLKNFDLLTPIEPYAKIVAGCLMLNHYHLLISPNKKNGLSQLLQKVGTSYTMYFNKKNERTGRLFESTFKAKHIDKNEYASYVTQYIHLNPVKLFREPDQQAMLNKIESYEWSSLPDYIGNKSRFSILVNKTNFREEILGLKAEEYKNFLGELFYGLHQAKPTAMR